MTGHTARDHLASGSVIGRVSGVFAALLAGLLAGACIVHHSDQPLRKKNLLRQGRFRLLQSAAIVLGSEFRT